VDEVPAIRTVAQVIERVAALVDAWPSV
jgi:hypothetical protein